MDIEGIRVDAGAMKDSFYLQDSFSFASKLGPSDRSSRPGNLRTGSPDAGGEVTVIKTNCFECHSKCGVLAHVKDGKLIKIEGNTEEPRSKGMICSKGFSATQMLYSPDRLNYPLRRTNPKERGKILVGSESVGMRRSISLWIEF